MAREWKQTDMGPELQMIAAFAWDTFTSSHSFSAQDSVGAGEGEGAEAGRAVAGREPFVQHLSRPFCLCQVRHASYNFRFRDTIAS